MTESSLREGGKDPEDSTSALKNPEGGGNNFSDGKEWEGTAHEPASMTREDGRKGL